MTSRFVLTVLAAAVVGGALPSFAQGREVDPPQQPSAQPQPAPPNQQPQTPRGGDRREQQGQRDANRPPRQPQDPAQAQPRNDGRRGDNDSRHADRGHGNDHHGQDQRNGHSNGYVVARPSYVYTPPRVYYGGPTVYYGSVPQGYYPYNGFSGYGGYNGYAGNGAPVVFQPGDYLPPELRQQQYVVQDWEWRGLTPPPYGYHWMFLSPDNYALVLDSTGQIFSVVASR